MWQLNFIINLFKISLTTFYPLTPLMGTGTGEKSASESPEEARARRLFEQLETGVHRFTGGCGLWIRASRRGDRVACVLVRRRRAPARALDSDPRTLAARATRFLSGSRTFLFTTAQCPPVSCFTHKYTTVRSVLNIVVLVLYILVYTLRVNLSRSLIAIEHRIRRDGQRVHSRA